MNITSAVNVVWTAEPLVASTSSAHILWFPLRIYSNGYIKLTFEMWALKGVQQINSSGDFLGETFKETRISKD